ncbi:hypothetical protein HK097_011484 [Rhizophlyctis rosea]|uniref:DUF1168-domain-containing protein n=1 Tax=Rhizophlyctis rosea TaxID=64517 RepID=A0AAD5SNV7_9FUNG|nr:hypothetical protein HK097_011484 [Rhizophlyctis rosea]
MSPTPPPTTTASSDSDTPQPTRKKLTDPYDIQKHQLDKLMTRIDKPIVLPSKPDTLKPKAPREFVRNVQGSSAGAGSGEFHVYRALRRKEYARQKVMDEEAKAEEEQRAFHEKLETLKAEDEARMAKKREKRKKRKGKGGGKDANKKAKTDGDKEGGGAAKSAEEEGDSSEDEEGGKKRVKMNVDEKKDARSVSEAGSS